MIAPHDDAGDVPLPTRTDDAQVRILRSVASLEREHVVSVALVPRPYQSPHRAHPATIDDR